MAKRTENVSKPFYKRAWFWILVVLVLLIIGAASNSGDDTANRPTSSPVGFNVTAAYDKVKTGQTRAEVEKEINKKAANCSTSEAQSVGTVEVCNYGNPLVNHGVLSVSYLNGQVYSKVKTTN